MSSNRFTTHDVLNQPSPLAPYDMYATDRALQEGLVREGGGFAVEQVASFGPVAGGEMMTLGFSANEQRPRFRPFDAYGHRIDEVEFHPAYHRIMEIATAHGVPSFAWRNQETPGAHVARAALLYFWADGAR
jgi:putative acyl-CoA dehydrogenase